MISPDAIIESSEIATFVSGVIDQIRNGVDAARSRGVDCSPPDSVEFEVFVTCGGDVASQAENVDDGIGWKHHKIRFTVPLRNNQLNH